MMSFRRSRFAAFGLVIGLVLTNLLLIRQNLALRSALEGRRTPSLQEGDRVTSFAAPDLTGKIVAVDFIGSDPARVLLYLATDCPHTDFQFPYWCRVIKAADPDRFEFLGLVDRSIDLDEVLRYLSLQQCDLSGRVLQVDSELVSKFRLSMTPTTLLVEGNGTVRRVWTGLWHRQDVQEALQIVEGGLP